MHTVVALALPSVVAFDLSIPAQVFGHRDERDAYDFRVCAARPGLVPTTTGFEVTAAHGLAALRGADTVVVPGFEPLEDPPAEVLAALRAAHRRGARMVSVCTGAFALAAAGLLDGRPAATHWRDAAELARRFPAVSVRPEVLYIDDGQVLTSAGVAAGIDLCLHVARSDRGAAAANRIARRLVAAAHRGGGQAQYIDRFVPAATATGMAATCAWALERLDAPLTVAQLAAHTGFAVRTFSRRFRAELGIAPLQWLIAARIDRARELLESSDLPVEQVARHAGLGTAANLRLHLHRAVRSTPSAYRAAFREPPPGPGLG